jgi:glycerate 2-kinase
MNQNQNTIRKILIAPDSFKDCLTSLEVAGFLSDGIKENSPNTEISLFPVADGGEGTASCIAWHRGGTWIETEVMDPLFRIIPARYLVLDDGVTAVIELAGASGLEILSAGERNPLNTSTFGTGQLIRDAMDRGLRKIILTIGGSATVDGGTGIASALGFKFSDKENNIIEPVRGGNLKEICYIYSEGVHSALGETEIVIACDVQNILNGPEGAARIYGPQKGADQAAVGILEDGLKHLSTLVLSNTGFDADKYPGTGAAGGASLFLLSYGKGELKRGFEIIAGLTGFVDAIKQSDLVITGEGKIDSQTAYGKVVASVALIASKMQIPLIGVAGVFTEERERVRQSLGAQEVYSVRELAENDTDSFKNAPVYLKEIGRLIANGFINRV